MAISSIRLQNFKCFKDSGRIILAPLTVIFGRNNTGKSSILQSLLLLRQTLDAPADVARLNLRGPAYCAGAYADIVHMHKVKRQNVSFEVGVAIGRGKGREGHLELEFKSDEPQAPRLARLAVTSPQQDPIVISPGPGAGGPYELTIGSDNLGGGKKADFRFSVNQFLPLIGEEPHVGRPNVRRERARATARKVLKVVEDSLRSTRAVGAFRRQPERRYEYQGRPAEAVDTTGQHVIDALVEDANRRGRHRGELVRGVNRWLEKVGRVRLMPIRAITRQSKIYEIRLKDTDSGRWANFADVGFGIGQALPVLIEGLRTPEHGIFLVQEPEIHLHPDAQLAMADFLIALVHAGRQVIVETHSENILLRIRHAVLRHAGAEGNTDGGLAKENIGIIHVSKMADGTSHAAVG